MAWCLQILRYSFGTEQNSKAPFTPLKECAEGNLLSHRSRFFPQRLPRNGRREALGRGLVLRFYDIASERSKTPRPHSPLCKSVPRAFF